MEYKYANLYTDCKDNIQIWSIFKNYNIQVEVSYWSTAHFKLVL